MAMHAALSRSYDILRDHIATTRQTSLQKSTSDYASVFLFNYL